MHSDVRSDEVLVLRPPHVEDGAQLWRIARDSQTLDLNSSYAYVLWARDFSETSRLALINGEAAGFVIGYRRPSAPDCLFIWQIAVDDRWRGRGIAGKLLRSLVDELTSPAIRTMQTTITAENIASQRLFRGFAQQWHHATVTVSALFGEHHFTPAGEPPTIEHAAEHLYEIGPSRPI